MGIDRRAITATLRAVDEFRKMAGVKKDMSIHTVATFLYIAANPGVTTKAICDGLNLAQTSVSRHTQLLRKEFVNRKTGEAVYGYNLIEDRNDPYEGRRLIYDLTPKGHQMAETISDLVSLAVR